MRGAGSPTPRILIGDSCPAAGRRQGRIAEDGGTIDKVGMHVKMYDVIYLM